MHHWLKVFTAETQGKRKVDMGFVNDTPYIHVSLVDSTGDIFSSTTCFFPEWTWVNMGPDFSLFFEDDDLV